IYDQYGIEEGFAQTILSQLMKSSFQGKTHVFALKNMFYPHASIQEQLEMAGIGEDVIFENIKRILKLT
ncbi:MAG: hypothetical protein J5736_05745, partial [Bacilli bacterium]|nr:hypothetical protein [Bacilli bacterium]